MSSLVLELQKDALDPSVKVSDLLRKALVVATKLNLSEFKNWIDNELGGYHGDDGSTITQYRHLNLKGELKATHPHFGFIPYTVTHPESNRALSRRPLKQSIGKLEFLSEKNDPDSTLIMPFPQEVLNELDKGQGNLELGIVPVLVMDRARVKGVVDAVRNTILNWSLKLEQDGILGNELSFSNEEKGKATGITCNIQNFTGVAVNVIADNFQIGDYASIDPELKRLGVSQKERNELENLWDEMKTPSITGDQKENLLKRGGEWLARNAGTIGSLSQTIKGWFDSLSQL